MYWVQLWRLCPDIITYGAMISACEKAAEYLNQERSVECLVRTLGHPDIQTLCFFVGRTPWSAAVGLVVHDHVHVKDVTGKGGNLQ